MIMFAGDSFSAYDDEESWPFYFAKEMNLGFKNFSIPGSSIWTAFEKIDAEDYKFFENYYDYLIITCTHYRRIPFCNDPHMSYFTGHIEKEPFDSEEKNNNMAHVNYYEKFYSEKMHKFLYERIIEFIIIKYFNKTKIILLPAFDASLLTLNKEAKTFKENFMYTNIPLQKIGPYNHYKNHMSKNTNIKFGNLLADKVKHTSHGLITFTNEEIKDIAK